LGVAAEAVRVAARRSLEKAFTEAITRFAIKDNGSRVDELEPIG
jgi:hypothetical protein